MSPVRPELATASLHSNPSAVSTCYLGKLYYLGYGRSNRFGPSRLFTSGAIASLYPSLDTAAHAIEPQRTRGTYWWVIEVPTVVIEPSRGPQLLLVGDGWSSDTLQTFAPALPTRKQRLNDEPIRRPFGELAKALMQQLPKEGWALQFADKLPLATFPFVRNRSVPGQTLRWRQEKWITAPKSAIRLVSTVCHWLAEEPNVPGTDQTR